MADERFKKLEQEKAAKKQAVAKEAEQIRAAKKAKKKGN